MNAPATLARALPSPVDVSHETARRRFGRIDNRVLRRLFEAGRDDEALASFFGCGLAAVRAHRYALGLRRRKRRGSEFEHMESPHTGSQSRHAPKSLVGRIAKLPPVDHPALTEARTIYPSSVVPVEGLLNVLVAGENSWKIGGRILKGRWKGLPVFTLTLEERATCPTSCALYRSCYGNSMHLAKRIVAGAALEARLPLEVGVLASRYPAGFAVRLHVLGDFYSEGYVALWRELVERYPNLHVFGFTARIAPTDPITRALYGFVVDHWPRFAIRFSNAPTPILSTVTIEHPLQRPADAIICPAQLGKTASCSTCALCWSTERRIAFLRH